MLGQQQQATAQPESAPEPDPEPETMVMPIALQGYRVGPVRIVIFAAGEEDYGRAYDGLSIEWLRAAER